MKIPAVHLYAPIVHAGISPDGGHAHVVVPEYDALEKARPLRMFLLKLDGGEGWVSMGEVGDTFHSPSWSSDGQRLAAFRTHGIVQDLAVFDVRDLSAEPVALAGMPHGAVAMKWWGTPGLPLCIGQDADGCRRVYAWKALDEAPEPVTPAARRVADFAVVFGGQKLAWLYGPPRHVGREHPGTSLFIQDLWGALPSAVETPEMLLGFLGWSPCGRWLAGMGRPQKEPLTSPRLWVYDTVESTWVRLLEDLDGWITMYDWLSVGEGEPSLMVSVDEGVCGRVYRVSLDGSPTPIGPRDMYLSGAHADRSRGRMLVMAQDGHLPQHVRLWEPGSGVLKRITNFNSRIRKGGLAKQETFRWTSSDGLALEGLLMRPEGDGPHPMIVWLHGGPAEHIQRTFSAYFQVFVASGFAVFAPNFRGSTARGDAFLQALVGDLCGADVEDVETGVRALIRQGVAHKRRVGITGWSYGGALALSVASAYPWVRAIVAGAPVVDWLTVFGSATWPHVTQAYFPGPPWDVPEAYDAASPIRRLKDVKAPTLLLHGELDDRVPVSQPRLVYRILQARGTPTDFRVFPGEKHVFGAPWAIEEMLVRTLAWMRRFLLEA